MVHSKNTQMVQTSAKADVSGCLILGFPMVAFLNATAK